jgi:hypothetical protein
MKQWRCLAALAVLGLALPVLGSETKLKKPNLNLRAAPRFAFSPVNVLFTAELTGGDDVEEFYCPELEWEWDDGGKSVQEPDCDPFEAGKTKIERRFTAAHEYRVASTYNVKVSLKRTGKAFAVQTVRVSVRPGAGDHTDIQEN